MEEDIDNSMTQKLVVVRQNMENSESPVARKPEASTPKIEGSEPPLVGKTEVVTPKVDGPEAPQERKSEAKPETVTPKVGDNNNSGAHKPEVVSAKAEGGETPVARKPEVVAPKPEVKPEAVTPKVEVPNNVAARKPEAAMPKVEVPNNVAARKPEAVMPKVEVLNNVAARKPEAAMPKTEGTNNSQQVRRPEANMPRVERDLVIPETPATSSPGTPVIVRYKRVPPAYTRFIPQHEAAKVHLIEEQCRSFCLSLFFRERDSVHSLGITSSIPGEGKSFIASMIAHVLSSDSSVPVLLVECDWENANYQDYFGIPPVPGLAEWMRGECTEADIRYKVSDNLSVIRAGDGQQDAVRLIQYILKRGLRSTLARNNENLLIDLPPVITSSYSVFAANMVEALALVVRAGVTPDNLVADACNYLSNLPVQGIILNQVDYRSRPYSAARKTL